VNDSDGVRGSELELPDDGALEDGRREPTPNPSQLPVWKTIRDALRAIAGDWKSLLKAIVGPSILLAVVSIEGDFSDYDSLRAAVALLASPVLMTLIAVSCHRLVILGVGDLPSRWGFFWTPRETRFLGWSIKLLIGWLVVVFGVFVLWDRLGGDRILDFFHSVLALGQLPLILMIAPFILASMYVGARLSLLLAATAIDKDSTPRESWELSRGNGWRLVAVIFLPSVLFLPIMLEISPTVPSLASEALIGFLGVIWGVVGIAGLSRAFCWFSE
jgi:hypothetical protein